MAISNKFGSMVVTTGNKSEMSVGYATLYGDMNGGFNPIKDLYKMQVSALSAWRNRWKPPGAQGAGRRGHSRKTSSTRRHRPSCAQPEGSGFAAALSGPRRHPRMPGRERDARLRHRRPRATIGRDREEGRAAALHRRIQAPAGGAGRQDHARTSAATAATRSPTTDALSTPRR
jgi:hypothetical protein